MMLSLGACGATEKAAQKTEEKITVDYPLDQYNLEAYTQPYWSDEIVYQESVLPLENKDGKVEDLQLLWQTVIGY